MEAVVYGVKIGFAARIGGLLFFVWALLHIWVGFNGLQLYHEKTAPIGLWNAVIGGEKVPHQAFQHPLPGTPTAYAMKQLMLNFYLDVGGYGVLGVLVAYMVYFKGSWLFYLIGVVVIGIADLTFLWLMVYPGKVIEMILPVLAGPMVYLLAVIITPFGLPPFNLDELKVGRTGFTRIQS